jgi:hypothetical protein
LNPLRSESHVETAFQPERKAASFQRFRELASRAALLAATPFQALSAAVEVRSADHALDDPRKSIRGACRVGGRARSIAEID